MGNRCLLVVVAFVLAACSHEPPAYESHITTPAPSAAAAPVTASWFDTFNRPDGPLGDGWDLRGPYVNSFPLPPATDGFIKDGAFTYAGNQTVYAVRQFRSPVQRMGTTGEFQQIRDGSETGLAMAITPNDNIVSDMIHFAVNRSGWDLTVRRGAGFDPVAKGTFTPTLKFGTTYTFELAATATGVTVTVPGSPPITTPADLNGLIGDRAFWEEYTTQPAGTVFDFNTVWAVEEGQPLQPVG